MVEITYNNSTKKTFPGLLSPVYLIMGDDAALKHEVVEKLLAEALDPSFADFDRETIDFGAGGDGGEGDDPAGRLLSAAASAPFMSPRRVVVGVSVQRLSKEAQDTVALGVKSLPILPNLMRRCAGVRSGTPKRQAGGELSQKSGLYDWLCCDLPGARCEGS